MTFSRSRIGITCLGLSLAMALGACSQPVEGEAIQPQTPAVTEVTYHPCDDLPAEPIREAGLDRWEPSRQDHKNPTSHACNFQANEPRWGVSIAAIDKTLQDLNPDKYTVLQRIDIAGRPTHVIDWAGGRACTVAIEIEPGIIDFMVGYGSNELFTTPQAACDQALKVVNIFAPYLPEHL